MSETKPDFSPLAEKKLSKEICYRGNAVGPWKQREAGAGFLYPLVLVQTAVTHPFIASWALSTLQKNVALDSSPVWPLTARDPESRGRDASARRGSCAQGPT